MLSVAILALLFIIVTILIIVELGILPGLSISGIFAIIISIFAFYYAYDSFGVWGVTTTVLIYVVGIPILVKYILEKNRHLFPKLNTVVEGKVNPLEEIQVSVGDKGVAESRMAPVGFAVFNNQRMEAYSIEGVISKGDTIEVVKIENNKVYVTDDVTA